MKLDKRLKEDNDVYRCSVCGYIFSPIPNRRDLSPPGPPLGKLDRA